MRALHPAKAVAASILLALTASCREPTNSNDAPSGKPSSVRVSGLIAIQAPDTVRELRLDVGRFSRRQLSDEELIEAVTRHDSVVVIGFMPIGARRTSETGVIPAMSRAHVQQFRNEAVRLGVAVIQAMPNSSTIIARIPPLLAPQLRRLPFVNYVAPSSYSYSTQAPQDTSWGARIVGAPYVWQFFGNAGNSAWITILDTGVDSIHVNTAELDGPENPLELRYIAGFTDNDPYQTPVFPNLAHGSKVAGIISARNNSVGWIGIANAPYGFTSVRVCKPLVINGVYANWCPNWAIESALYWTAVNGYPHQIVNMSLGGCGFTLEELIAYNEPIQRTIEAGNIVVAAAGNYPDACGSQNEVLYPAKFSGVVAVSGTLQSDQFASTTDPTNPCISNGVTHGSRYGPEVALAAPFYVDAAMGAGGTYAFGCGTSFAAPVVSGVAAMIWTQHPSWSASQVVQRLKDTALPLGSGHPNAYFGWGRVSAFNAFYEPPNNPPGFTVAIDGPDPVLPTSYCQYFAQTTGGTAPFSFAWTQDGNSVGDGTAYYHATTGYDPFSLSVLVTDANGLTAYYPRSISVSWGASQCNDQ